jgi:glycosyltransferase involved in cell wall biosynthesis
MECSVIIPTYNRSHRLRELLASLAAQDGACRFDVIVCDDGSADDTRAVVESFRERLALSYCFQEDRGFRAGDAAQAGATFEHVI